MVKVPEVEDLQLSSRTMENLYSRPKVSNRTNKRGILVVCRVITAQCRVNFINLLFPSLLLRNSEKHFISQPPVEAGLAERLWFNTSFHRAVPTLWLLSYEDRHSRAGDTTLHLSQGQQLKSKSGKQKRNTNVDNRSGMDTQGRVQSYNRLSWISILVVGIAEMADRERDSGNSMRSYPCFVYPRRTSVREQLRVLEPGYLRSNSHFVMEAFRGIKAQSSSHSQTYFTGLPWG